MFLFKSGNSESRLLRKHSKHWFVRVITLTLLSPLLTACAPATDNARACDLFTEGFYFAMQEEGSAYGMDGWRAAANEAAKISDSRLSYEFSRFASGGPESSDAQLMIAELCMSNQSSQNQVTEGSESTEPETNSVEYCTEGYYPNEDLELIVRYDAGKLWYEVTNLGPQCLFEFGYPTYVIQSADGSGQTHWVSDYCEFESSYGEYGLLTGETYVSKEISYDPATTNELCDPEFSEPLPQGEYHLIVQVAGLESPFETIYVD